MRFANVPFFYALWAVVLLGVILFWLFRRKSMIFQRFAQGHLLETIADSMDPRRPVQKMVLLLLVVALSVLALTRPQWGFEWQEVRREGLDILIAVDTSKSMLTQDVKPNRLQRTKLAVKDLLKRLKGDRIGLIAFSGTAFLVCPLTVDYNGFLLSLEDLDIESIPQGGTNVAQAITEAVKAYDKTPGKNKVLVILTDGENHEGDPLGWARKAQDADIKVYTIGIGTREGELIRIENALGEQEFLKDIDGNFVKSRLNEELLKGIALATGGVYVRASGVQVGLNLIYDRELSRLQKREIESKMEKRYHERFQIPLGLAFLFLIGETCLTTRKKRKPQ